MRLETAWLLQAETPKQRLLTLKILVPPFYTWILQLQQLISKANIDEAWGLYPNGIDVVVNNAGYVLRALFRSQRKRSIYY